MATSFFFFFFLFMMMTLFFPQPALADIRHYKINTKDNMVPSFLIVDYFEFKQNLGRFQLNITDIHISNPNPNHQLNLSQIGFFFAPINPRGSYPSREFRCALNSSDIVDKIVYTFDNLSNNNSSFFVDIKRTHMYTLYFQNCGNEDVRVSMDVRYAMYNLDAKTGRPSYLWPSQIYSMTRVYPIFCLLYILFAFLWFCYILYDNYKNNQPITIRLFFSLVLVFKGCSLIFQVLNDFYILDNGCSQCWVSILLSFTSEFFREACLLTYILLVVTGWSIVKPKLFHGDRIWVMIIFSMNLFMTAMKIVVDQKPPTQEVSAFDPPTLFLYFNFFYSIPIGFAYLPTREFMRITEKPSIFLKYHWLFCSLAFSYNGYILLKMVSNVAVVLVTHANQYSLSVVVLWELLELLFYVYFGYKLRQLEVNKEEQIVTVNADIEKAVAEILGQNWDDSVVH